MTQSSSFTTRDLFDAERPTGDMVSRYKDWELPLSDGTKLTGRVTNYVVVRRLGVAYCELYLNVGEPGRCAGIIKALLEPFAADPQFFLPEAMRNNEIKIRRNDHDVKVRYNQLPVMPTFAIYASARLDLSIKEALVDTWGSRGIELTIMDQNYVDAHERKLRPYAFICHAFTDKEAIARPLAERLRESVGTIWYDEYSLRVGDSLRESIENGLKRSDRCVIILSKAFLKNQGWAKREFDSIYTREIVEKRKVILPVWVDVSRDNLYQYSPILADRVGVMWSEGIDSVVAKLATSLRQQMD
jgi:TIR domain